LNTAFTNNSENASEYSWNFDDGEISSDFEPVHTFENTSEDLASYSVEFIAIAENGCHDSTTVVITAYPELIIEISLSQDEGCSPFEVQTPFIENTSQITWSFGDASNDSNTQMVSHVYLNDSNNTQSFILSAIGMSEFGCVGEYSSLINVNPQPIAQFMTNLTEGCSPFVVNILDSSTLADLNWNYGDGVNATGFNGETHQYSFQNLGEETITQEISLTVIGDGGCVDTQSVEIDIFPEVISQFSTTQASCSPISATFTNESSENQTYSWAFGDGAISEDVNPIHIFTNPSSVEDADYIVTLTVTSEMGCSNLSTEVITALATPVADISLSQSEGCGSFYAIAEAQSGEGYNYQWTFNMAPYTHNEITTPGLLFNSPGTYELELEVTGANGCTVENTESVHVFEIPTVNFSVEDVCHGTPSQFTDLTTINGADEIVEWNWTLGNGEISNEQSPNYIYNTAGLYNVELEIVTNFCSAIFTTTTYVEELPSMIASSDISSGCSPVIVSFAAQINDDASIFWDFGDDQSSNNSNEEHTYLNENIDANGTTFVVTATATSPMGCVAVDTLEISALKGAVAFVTSSDNGCAPLNTTFTNNSENATEYSWNFDDGEVSNDFEPVHTFDNTSDNLTSYSVELIAISENGCNDSTTVVITAFPELTLEVSLSQHEGCSPFAVQTPFIENASQITWSFGDESNDSNTQMVSHVYLNETNNTQVFTLSAIGVSEYGCVAVDTLEVSALKSAIAAVTSTGNGCAPLSTTFTNNSEYATDYFWNFSGGDVSSDFEPIHTFDNTSDNLTSYPIELIAIAENGCNDTTVVHVTVYPEMVAQFNSPQASCSPFEVVFTNESSVNATFEWTFGDGVLSTELNPTHLFENENTGDDETYNVELTVTSEYGCSNTATSEIAVFATPVVNFHVTPVTQTFPNTTVAIEDLSTSGLSSSILWNFGDGNISTNENPGEHTYDTWGVFSISLIISNEYCSNDGVETINILSPTSELAFTGRGEGCAPLTVDFTNLSQYANNYNWYFGDGTTVLSENATHTFNEAGTYDITLEAVSYDGVVVEETQYASVTVFPRAQSDFSLFPTEVFAPGEPIQFYNLSTDADEFVWYFGNGETSSDENPTYEYTNPGNYNVTLTANNEWGCINTFSYENAVTAKDGGLLVFPTAFTPITGGGNGGTYDLQGYDNDVFRPLHGGVLDFEVFVFNKYGEQIFYSSDINIGWDGYVDGILATQDVYAYKAIATLSNGTLVEKAGTVTLISK
jgi:PKD repeat protein